MRRLRFWSSSLDCETVKMKAQRQAELLKIVRSRNVSCQAELVDTLNERGFAVSQTTVSRDIGDLGLVRLKGAADTARYAEPTMRDAPAMRDSALKRIASQALLTVESTGNIVVVKTQPGAAQGLAWAIDAADLPGVAGTVAGDDTILVACSHGASGKGIEKSLMGYALEKR